jgi:hypothetical protein
MDQLDEQGINFNNLPIFLHDVPFITKTSVNGSTLTQDNNITIEIKQRTAMANRASYGRKKQLRSQYFGRTEKRTLYNMVARPILKYGSER